MVRLGLLLLLQLLLRPLMLLRWLLLLLRWLLLLWRAVLLLLLLLLLVPLWPWLGTRLLLRLLVDVGLMADHWARRGPLLVCLEATCVARLLLLLPGAPV